VARIQRRRRVGCQLPCQIVQASGRHSDARVVTLSEGGLAVVSALRFEQGDPIWMRIAPRRGGPSIDVSAIVWNDRRAGSSARLRRLGCVVSDPSTAFLALLDRLEPAASRPAPTRPKGVCVALPKSNARQDEQAEQDLPRSREIQPPPKPEPEENLPYFRVRLQQIGGPRTRMLSVKARSATQAQQRALAELERICGDAGAWGVLEIRRI